MSNDIKSMKFLMLNIKTYIINLIELKYINLLIIYIVKYVNNLKKLLEDDIVKDYYSDKDDYYEWNTKSLKDYVESESKTLLSPEFKSCGYSWYSSYYYYYFYD